ncbi:SPOR domain-containing protein [Sphingomonas sp. G-3-2-10]|uniref:SPOR domain-containing protein n=1 Tax=Sphingomonas sp. G-3-2-10 TaxID=2728838 RepID=UPI00146D278A|nr:SPOR domain-containing protein [Sphingomonas sp. G-3-2-10]NML04501.1 tetratricopeptide repeat protein [Sphingomonas sp. G-3-2-10]
MKTRTLLSIGISALVVTGGMVGIGVPGMIATAAGTENPKRAASEAANARKAIAKRDAAKAIKFAEAAVAYAPQSAEYRALLGQSYLLAGRFASARTALGDSLTLDPSDGRVALNYALSQIAQGDWAGARGTLDKYEGTIAASDRGLAYALAGDPVKAVDVLVPAVRAADATAKTRQNYALSLALAGRWQEAKTIAAMDVPADQLDARIMQWASFSRPTNAYDQVASLLGVRAVEDQGQPTALALVMPGNIGVAAVAPKPADPVDAYMPGVPENAPQVVAEVEADPYAAPVEAAPAAVQVAGTGPQVVFGPRAEVVQAVPAAAPRRAATPAPVRAAPTRLAAAPAVQRVSYAKGGWVVQLGAFDNAAVARDAWKRTTARVPALASQTPKGASISSRGSSFYRLSVGGFARADADSLCRTVRSTGGTCFVRAQSGGDQVASWVNPRRNVQMASR